MTDKMLGSMTPAILQLARALYDVKATTAVRLTERCWL